MKAYDAQAKINYFFDQLTLLSSIYIEPWFSWLGRGVRERSVENIKKKKKTNRRKTF